MLRTRRFVMIRTFHHAEFTAEHLAAAKDGRVVSVCLPARNEQDTVGTIVDILRTELVERVGLIDEIIVIDDHSTDRTADLAAAAIAQVDLGTRLHRNRPLEELAPQAMSVLQTALRRAQPDLVATAAILARPGVEPMVIDVTERPPLAQVPEYRRSTA
jgi:hypothetical protein